MVIGRFGSNPAAPTTCDTVVVDYPTGRTYNVTLPPGTWTKVLDTTGAVAASDNACTSLAVTVFKKN
ncbi:MULTISPECIES: hypothetical protein [unclassified Streptomyces]|uniref:hypothetical protein n=1 Tax=unclassified Streptomyces TaxID=2593676 RepID=UPI002E153544|nr:hypothetical protein OG324_44095 [Streptomyces sp. NBC_01236]